MSGFRALIVDDKPPSRRVLRQLVRKHPEVTVVGEARDSAEALAALAELEPDLVFLDIQLPGKSGIDVVRERGVERMPAVVFVTAYDEFCGSGVRAGGAGLFNEAGEPGPVRRHHAAGAAGREEAGQRGSGAACSGAACVA